MDKWTGGQVDRSVHVQVERQTDELRQSQRQVQVSPGGTDPGQRSSHHRPHAEAEGQDGRRPEPSSRGRPLHGCNANTLTAGDVSYRDSSQQVPQKVTHRIQVCTHVSVQRTNILVSLSTGLSSREGQITEPPGVGSRARPEWRLSSGESDSNRCRGLVQRM